MKLKSVTIIHSQTTETVRLPDGGDGGQVTVHPALRSKLPLKRKVRAKKTREKRKSKEGGHLSPSKSKISPKKKKRVSAAVGAEETRKKSGDTAAIIEIPPSKVKKSPQATANKRKKKKKEVIDYSSAQIDGDGKKNVNAEVVHNPLTPDTDPVGKVQNWLLKSQPSFPKSKSTPERLTDKNRSPHKRPTIRPRTEKGKSHSIGNLPGDKEKVRLQVVYKPPFKFSVKLRKPDKSVVVERVVEKAAKKPERKAPRTGVLVRTVREKPEKQPIPKNATAPEPASVAPASNATNSANNIDSNTHTVHSDLEVLLSESEFLFTGD